MLKLYLMIGGFAIVGGVVFGAYKSYNNMQEEIKILTANNAKLETALETSEASINSLQAQAELNAKLTQQLQADLQKAEAYGDELRSKLSRINLVQEALKDAEKLEGKMNGATANLWRGLMEDTGGNSNVPLPDWLQPVQPNSSSGDQNSNENREDDSPASVETEASPAG